MADLQLAVQSAAFELLSEAATVTDLAAVHQHVPDQDQPPMVILGDTSASPAGGKGGGLDRIEFEILSVVREPGREHLTPLMAAVRAVIEDAALAADGASLSPPVFEGEDIELLEDGQTYLGGQRFSLFAQAA